MDLLTIFLIAIGLAMDAFAVSLSVGARPATQRSDILRLSFHFGVFQGLMTLLGWLGGSGLRAGMPIRLAGTSPPA